MVAANSRWVSGLLIPPTRGGEDLFTGWWQHPSTYGYTLGAAKVVIYRPTDPEDQGLVDGLRTYLHGLT